MRAIIVRPIFQMVLSAQPGLEFTPTLSFADDLAETPPSCCFAIPVLSSYYGPNFVRLRRTRYCISALINGAYQEIPTTLRFPYLIVKIPGAGFDVRFRILITKSEFHSSPDSAQVRDSVVRTIWMQYFQGRNRGRYVRKTKAKRPIMPSNEDYDLMLNEMLLLRYGGKSKLIQEKEGLLLLQVEEMELLDTLFTKHGVLLVGTTPFFGMTVEQLVRV